MKCTIIPIGVLKENFEADFVKGRVYNKGTNQLAQYADHDSKSRFVLRTYVPGYGKVPTSRVIMALFLNKSLPAGSIVRIRNRNSLDVSIANLYLAEKGERLPIEFRTDEREWIGYDHQKDFVDAKAGDEMAIANAELFEGQTLSPKNGKVPLRIVA